MFDFQEAFSSKIISTVEATQAQYRHSSKKQKINSFFVMFLEITVLIVYPFSEVPFVLTLQRFVLLIINLEYLMSFFLLKV